MNYGSFFANSTEIPSEDEINKSPSVKLDEEEPIEYNEPEIVEKALRVISSRDDLIALKPTRAIKGIHLAFRPSVKDIVMVTKKLPELSIVQMPKSYKTSFSKAMSLQFENLHIALVEGDVWGHRKDIDEWATVRIIKSRLAEAIAKFPSD